MTRRSRRTVWVAAVAVVAMLLGLTVLVVLDRADRQNADDPRSTTAQGAGALGTLLSNSGVRVDTVDSVDQAIRRTGPDSTLVVATPQVLTADQAARLTQAAPNRVLLLRPTTPALQAFGVQADAVPAVDGPLPAGCDAPAARRAGVVAFDDQKAAYRPSAPNDFSCYPAGSGFSYLRAGTQAGQQIDLLAGGISNRQLAQEGNAALALNVLGARPEVVWLMAEDAGAATTSTRPDRPTLLPRWWSLAAVQTVIALVAVGIWRGRRFGPIMTEPLPVRVRAAETVEGHGRLYFRLAARDRAAAALRRQTRQRLGRGFGHDTDPLALSAAVAGRTGRDARGVHQLLFGPPPADDDALLDLTRGLDQLEQEARQP